MFVQSKQKLRMTIEIRYIQHTKKCEKKKSTINMISRAQIEMNSILDKFMIINFEIARKMQKSILA